MSVAGCLENLLTYLNINNMKNLTSKDWIWVLITFVLSGIIGPFGLLPVFIVENTRHNKGEVDTFMTDRFATCVGAMVLGIGILVIIATNICNG